MKKISPILTIIFLLTTSLSFYQCTNDEDLFDGFPTVLDYVILPEVHEEITENEYNETVFDDIETDNVIMCPKGSVINIPGNSLTLTNGDEPEAPVTVEFVEIYKRGEMVKFAIQTYNEFTPLVSGGMIWVKATDANGEDVQLNGVSVVLPNKTEADDYEEDMIHFIGNTQNAPSGPVLSWTPGNGTVVFEPTNGVNGDYTLQPISSGWNHVGAVFDEEDELTQISVDVTNAQNPSLTEVFFVWEDYTTVTALTLENEGMLTSLPNSIPTDEDGTLVAIALIDGKLNFSAQPLTVAGDDVILMEVQPGTISELNGLLSTLD